MRELGPIEHGELAAGNVASMFGPRLRALVLGIGLAIQRFEDELFELLYGARQFPGKGAWCDHWGTLLGQPRGGLGDVEYTRILRGQAAARASTGNTDDQVVVAEELFPQLTVWRDDVYPAGVSWQFGPLPETIYGPQWPTLEGLFRAGVVLRSSKPPGVAYSFLVYPTTYFGFDDDPDAFGFDFGTYAEAF